jgi:hypothetical protein
MRHGQERSRQRLTGAANPYSTRGLGMENAIYAGIAYEVHAIGADGQQSPVNTANYKFHSGDKFLVYYRRLFRVTWRFTTSIRKASRR